MSHTSSGIGELALPGAGTMTCAQYPGSLEHEDTDAADFASWDVDRMQTLAHMVFADLE